MSDDSTADDSRGVSPVTQRSEQRLHAGELEAQRRFGAEGYWDDHSLNALLHTTIPARLAAFMEGLPFFFLATANSRGECDCSFRGREHDASGRPYPLVKVTDAKTVVFPDYRGNGLFNSLGNILVNGHAGLLFIDFQSRTRIRLNGSAEIIEDVQAWAAVWPLALRYVRVTAEQVYGNCKARIPEMQLVPPRDCDLQDS